MTREERSWVIYDWGNSAYSMIVTTTIFALFFKNYVASDYSDVASTAMLGYANTGAALFTAVLAPILGALADRRGKKPLFIIFWVVGLLSTAAIAGSQEGAWLPALIIYALSHIGFYGAVIFYDAFIVDVTEPDRADWISASAFGWGYIGGTIPFLIAIAMIQMPERFGFADSLLPTRISFVIAALWWGVFTIPFLRNSTQSHFIESKGNVISESFGQLVSTFKEVRKHRNTFLFLIAFFFYIDGVHTIIKMAVAFGSDIGIGTGGLIGAILLVQIVAFPSALIYGSLAKRFGAKRLLLVGVGVYAAVTIFAFFVSNVVQFMVMAAIVGSAQGGVQSLSRSLYSRLIPKENAAEFFGFYDIFGKFAAVMGPALVAIGAQLTGETRYGVLSLIVLFIIGTALLIPVKDTVNPAEST